MVDPLGYSLFQPVPHDWCNKGCGMCYPVCGMVHIKEPCRNGFKQKEIVGEIKRIKRGHR